MIKRTLSWLLGREPYQDSAKTPTKKARIDSTLLARNLDNLQNSFHKQINQSKRTQVQITELETKRISIQKELQSMRTSIEVFQRSSPASSVRKRSFLEEDLDAVKRCLDVSDLSAQMIAIRTRFINGESFSLVSTELMNVYAPSPVSDTDLKYYTIIQKIVQIIDNHQRKHEDWTMLIHSSLTHTPECDHSMYKLLITSPNFKKHVKVISTLIMNQGKMDGENPFDDFIAAVLSIYLAMAVLCPRYGKFELFTSQKDDVVDSRRHCVVYHVGASTEDEVLVYSTVFPGLKNDSGEILVKELVCSKMVYKLQ